MAVARWLGRSVRHCVKRCIRTVGATGDSFSPLSLPNLALWLTPEYGLYQERTGASATTPAVADGDPVGTWVGRAAGGALVYFTAPNDAARPVLRLAVQNGRNVVRFDGVNDYLMSATSLQFFPAKRGTISVVNRVTGTSSLGSGLLATYPAAAVDFEWLQQLAPDTKFKWYDGSSTHHSAANATGSWSVDTMLRSGDTTLLHYLLGSLADTLTITDNQPSSAVVALCASTSGIELLGADIGEVIADTAATNRAIIESYLNSRWGVY